MGFDGQMLGQELKIGLRDGHGHTIVDNVHVDIKEEAEDDIAGAAGIASLKLDNLNIGQQPPIQKEEKVSGKAGKGIKRSSERVWKGIKEDQYKNEESKMSKKIGSPRGEHILLLDI